MNIKIEEIEGKLVAFLDRELDTAAALDTEKALQPLKDCEDTMDVTVGLEFKNKGDKWLVDNIDDKDFEDLFEFYTYDIGIWPDMASLVSTSYIYSGSYYVDYYVYFTESVEEYKDMFTCDVYRDGSLIASGEKITSPKM